MCGVQEDFSVTTEKKLRQVKLVLQKLERALSEALVCGDGVCDGCDQRAHEALELLKELKADD